jgi:hypothetical protein
LVAVAVREEAGLQVPPKKIIKNIFLNVNKKNNLVF